MALRSRPIGEGGFAGTMRCDVCGGAALWRVRVVTGCCALGDALCDVCEAKRASLRLGDGWLWRGVRNGVHWLRRKVAA